MCTEPNRSYWDRCPGCDGTSLRDRFRIGGYQILECADCSLQFVNQRFTPEELAPYYAAETVESVIYAEGNRDNLNYYNRRLGDRLRSLRPPGSILDVGCSTGYFLSSLGSEWNRYGVEISAPAVEMARSTAGCTPENIVCGTLADAAIQVAELDVITMLDMLDHVPDPFSDLQRAHAMLADHGLLVVKVHNVACLWAKMSGPRFYAYVPPGHLFYFSPQSLAALLRRAGFRIVESHFYAHKLYLSTVFLRLSKGRQQSPLYGLHRRLIDTRLGNAPVYKNFRDIVTVIAQKQRS